MHPDWLPDLILLDDYDGDWHSYIEVVYDYFCRDFVSSKPAFEDKRFGLKRHPELEGKEATFWHVTSQGRDESERVPDLRRCERIRWLRPMIEATAHSKVRCWRNKRKANEERVVIALEDFSFVVILADRGDYVLLWTAYCVDHESRREKLLKDYKEYVKNQKG
ncbi:MAG: hypothetical protein ACOX3G_09640 [Armatimonadota bacterium]|jgi:hypothetical protein